MRLALFALTLLTCLPTFAQSQVSRIIIHGASRDTQVSEIRRSLGFSEGDTYDPKLVANAIKRIESNAIFRSVDISSKEVPAGTEVFVNVVLESLLAHIEIHAPKHWTSFIESRLALLKGERSSETEIKKAIDDLQESFRKMGYFQAEVEFRLSIDDKQNASLIVEVKENDPTLLGHIEVRADNQRLAGEAIEALGLSQGNVYRRDQLFEAIKSWREANAGRRYFDAHAKLVQEQYAPDTNTVDVIVEARLGQRYDLQLVGVKYFSARFLKQEITHLLSQSESTSPISQRVQTYLFSLYRRHGFRDVELSVARDLSVEVKEGPQHLVNEIVVKSDLEQYNEDIALRLRAILNDTYTSESLNDPASTFVDGLLVLDERSLVRAKAQLQEELREKGFLNCKLTGPQIRVNTQNHFVTLTLTAHLGPQTHIGALAIESSVLNSIDELKHCVDFSIGDALMTSRLEPPKSCMEESLWNQGYPYAQVLTDVDVSTDNTEAKIRFRVKPGPFVKIGSVELRGLITTRPETLASRVAIAKNDPYSLQKIVATRQALFNSDIFDRVEIFTEASGDDDATRVLIAEVHEKAKTSLEIGAGASLEDGPRVSFLTGQRNLFGLGMGFKSRLQLNYPALFYRLPFLYDDKMMTSLENRFKDESPFVRALLYTEAKLSFSLNYPYILASPWTTDGVADFSLNRELKIAYTLNRGGLDLGLVFKPLQHLRFGPSLDYEFAKFLCPDGYKEGRGCGDDVTGASTRRIDSGITQQVTFRLSASIDGRDSVLRPKNGYFVDATADVALGHADLGPKSPGIGYVKLMTNLNVFRPLSKSATWQLSMRVGQIIDLAEGNYVPLFKRFYLGGTNSIRGFAEDQILPADDPDWPADSFKPNPGVLSRGGYFMALLRGEIRFPLSTEHDGAIFIDTGELLNSISNFSFSSLAVGAGFGIRYLTPIGPLMFDLGVRIVDGIRAYEPGFWNLFGLHFSIGYF